MAKTRVRNLDKLERKLKAIPRAVSEAIREAYVKNAEELTAMQKRFVPTDEGDLRDSIEWRFGDSDDSRVGLKGRFGMAIIVTAGTDNDGDAPHARWVEFGTSDGKPSQPFFFGPYRALKKRMKSRVTRAQNKAIRKVAGR